jgi:hypothetical protein
LRIASVIVSLFVLCGRAVAIDEGTVKGTFELNGKRVELKHAYAHLHDNAEKLLDRPRELRILLTDREVTRESLHGIVFLPVEDLAEQGKVQGLLFELDPAKPNEMVATLLARPSEPGRGLMRTTHSVTGSKLFKRWSFDKQRVIGEIERLSKPNPDLPDLPVASFTLEFSAPVFNEPAITADLRGKAALNSPQVQTLSAVAGRMAAGDLAGARKFVSERGNRRFDLMMKLSGTDAAKLAKQGGLEMKRRAKSVQRVVVRGDRAVALYSKNEWATLVREGGRWKTDM